MALFDGLNALAGSLRDSMTAALGDRKTVWVVLCTPATGRPFPEYVEGDRIAVDADAGTIAVFDGDAAVRCYPAGTWSSYAEWVTDGGWLGAKIIRRTHAQPESLAEEMVNPLNTQHDVALTPATGPRMPSDRPRLIPLPRQRF